MRRKIKDFPESERPRERLMRQGVSSLSDAELIAVILRTGTAKENAVEMSRELLKRFNLKALSRVNISNLKRTCGIGEAKACQIAACFELGRRLSSFSEGNKPVIRGPKDVAKRMIPRMMGIKKEQLVGIYLDSRKRIIKEETIFSGSLNETIVNPREIFALAINEGAAAIILVHNHPSGDLKPSAEDIRMTKGIIEAGKLMDVQLLDHIIIGEKGHFSMKERGII